MELKVWVGGSEKIITGATYNTTCQDVIIALASAMGQTGRFQLVEKWRDSERPLPAAECPLQALQKWAEYAKEVRLCLVCIEVEESPGSLRSLNHLESKSPIQKGLNCNNNFVKSQISEQVQQSPSGAETLKRSSTFSGAHGTSSNFSLPTSTLKSEAGSSSNINRNQHLPNSRIHTLGLFSVPEFEATHSYNDSSQTVSPSIFQFPEINFSKQQLGTGKPEHSRTEQKGFRTTLSPHLASNDFFSASPPLKQSSPRENVSANNFIKPITKPQSQRLDTAFSISSFSSPKLAYQNSSSSAQISSSQSMSHPYSYKEPSSKFYSASSPHQQPQNHSKLQSNVLLQSQRVQTNYQANHEPRYQESTNSVAKTSPAGQSHSEITLNKGTGSSPIENYKHMISASESPNTLLSSDSTSLKRKPQTKPRTSTAGFENMIYNENLYSEQTSTNVKFATINKKISSSKPKVDVPTRSILSLVHNNAELLKSSQGKQQGPLQTNKFINQQQKQVDIERATFERSAWNQTKNNSQTSFSSSVSQGGLGSNELLKPAPTLLLQTNSLENRDQNPSWQREVSEIRSPVTNQPPLEHANKPPVPLRTISSSQHNSAFTKVLPKPGRVITSPPQSSGMLSSSSSSSPQSLIAYNLDSWGDNDHPKLTSPLPGRLDSNIEEYDLGRSFPDVLPPGEVPSRGENRSQGMVKPVKLNQTNELARILQDERRMQLKVLTSGQQEQLQVLELKIKQVTTDILALEKEEAEEIAKLERLSSDISKLEKREKVNRVELDELDSKEWTQAVDDQQKYEAQIKLEMQSWTQKLQLLVSQIEEKNKEAETLAAQVQEDKRKADEEIEKIEKLQEQAVLETVQVKEELSNLNQIIQNSEQKLRTLEQTISQVSAQLQLKEDMVKVLQEKLNVDMSEEGVGSELPLLETSEPSNVGQTQQVTTAASFSDTSLADSINGEVILKILEGRISPRTSPLPPGVGCDQVHETYQSALGIKTHSGVWV